MSLMLLVKVHSSGRRARRRLWPFLAVLPFLLLAACTSPEQKEAQHLERALALYEEGEDAKAMVELRNVLQINPKNADALFHIGLIHERAGRLPAAFAAYQEAVAERNSFVAANIRLGDLALWDNNLEVATQAVEAIEQAEPDNPDGLALKASLLLSRDDLDGARTAAEAALGRSPDHDKASAVVAAVLFRQGRVNEAFEELDAAIARRPDSAGLLFLKVMAHESLDEVEAAAETYARLIDLDPSNTQYRLAFAQFRRHQGDLPGAESALRDALDKAADITGVAADLVRLVYQARGAKAAQATLEDLVKRRPDDMDLRLLLAQLHVQQQQLAEAETVLGAIVQRGEPKDAVNEAKLALARIKSAAGEREAAETLLSQVLSDDSGHRGALVLQGTLALDDGELDDAVRSARAALREDPNWPPALGLLAQAHERKGEIDLAIEALWILISVDPRDAGSAERLAALLSSRGDREGALTVWDFVAAAAPDPSNAVRARAEIAIQQGRFDAAQADIARLLETPGEEATGALLRGRLAVAQNRFEEARNWYARAEAFVPAAPEPMFGMVLAFLSEGKIDEALHYLERRTREQPEDAVAFNLKGELLARAGRLEEADAAWSEANRLQPTWTGPQRRRAQAQLDAGHVDEAFEVYTTALEDAPDDPELAKETARAYSRHGRVEDALWAYERALEIEPNVDNTINEYAAHVADFGYQDSTSLDRAIALTEHFQTGDNPYFLDTLGWLHYRKNDLTTATTFLGRAVALAPDEPALRYHLGMALQASGREQEAVVHLENAVRDDADYPGIDEARATLVQLRKQLSDKPVQTTPAPRES